MKFLKIPDYFSQTSSTGLEALFDFLQWIVFFYASMIIVIVMNMLIILVVTWGALAIFRLLGIPWVDGTTKGYVNRS